MNMANCQVDSTKSNSNFLEYKRKLEAPGPIPFIYTISVKFNEKQAVLGHAAAE